jgi:hypothetical protein
LVTRWYLRKREREKLSVCILVTRWYFEKERERETFVLHTGYQMIF